VPLPLRPGIALAAVLLAPAANSLRLLTGQWDRRVGEAGQPDVGVERRRVGGPQ